MRATLRIVHRWLGLLLALPLLAQGLTGALLVFEPMSRAPDAAPAIAASVDDIVAAARGVAPDDLIPIRYVPPAAAAPAEVWFAHVANPRGRGTLVVRVNPVTMTPIWPPEAPDGLIEWSRGLHANFLLPGYGGRSIVGWTGVGLVLLCAMGIPIWWPSGGQLRSALTFSAAAEGYRFHRGLHGAAGIWSVMLLLIFGATGVVLGFPRTVRDVLHLPADGPPRTGASTGASARASAGASTGASARVDGAPAHRLDAAVALALAAAPGTSPRMIFLPIGAAGSIRVVLTPRGEEGSANTTTVTVDAAGTRIAGVQSPSTMTSAERMPRWLRDVHFGQGLGPVWRCLTVIAGLILPVFAVTGTAMWVLRNRNRRRFAAARQACASVVE